MTTRPSVLLLAAATLPPGADGAPTLRAALRLRHPQWAGDGFPRRPPPQAQGATGLNMDKTGPGDPYKSKAEWIWCAHKGHEHECAHRGRPEGWL